MIIVGTFHLVLGGWHQRQMIAKKLDPLLRDRD